MWAYLRLEARDRARHCGARDGTELAVGAMERVGVVTAYRYGLVTRRWGEQRAHMVYPAVGIEVEREGGRERETERERERERERRPIRLRPSSTWHGAASACSTPSSLPHK